MYRAPQVRTIRQQGQITAVSAGLAVRLAIVGTSLGRQEAVRASEVTRGEAGYPDALTEALEILGISEIRSEEVGGMVWLQNIDYTFEDPTSIVWNATVIPAPYIMSGTAVATGGTLAEDDYYYVVTAQRVTDLGGGTPVLGETLESNEVHVLTTGSTSKVTLVWNPVPGAYAYRVWRALAAGGPYDNCLIATVVGEFTNTYTDEGDTPSAETFPVANTAYKRPPTEATYYVDYVRKAYAYFTPVLYTRISDIISDYGLGSKIAKAATLAMGTSGRGNEAQYCWVMAIPDETLGTFETAFDLLANKDLELLVPLTDDLDVLIAALAHCRLASDPNHNKERRVVGGPAKGAMIGDASTSGTMIYEARQLDDNRAIYVAPWPYAYTQGDDGVVAEEELDGCFGAAAVAGLIASQPDRATSVTRKRVQGISKLGNPGGREIDNAQRDFMGASGICVICPQEGSTNVFIVRDALTTSLASLEDQDITIGLVEDFLRQSLRQSFQQFLGQKNIESIRAQIERLTLNILARFLKLGLITNYNPQTVSATVDPLFPDKVIVYFAYTPVYTIREIEFRYSFDLLAAAA